MPTTWDKVEVQTEKVIDENPEVWVAAAKNSLKNKNFNEALDNAQQAIQFANQSGNRSVLPECYAIQIYAYYEKNEKYDAQKIKDAYFSQGLKDFLMKNPDYVVVFKWHNNEEWYPFWEKIIKSWVRNLDLYNIKKYADLIDDKFLSENANQTLAIAAAEKGSLICLEKLYNGGFNLYATHNNDGNLTMLALANRHVSIANFLLDHKINSVNESNGKHQTALMIAVALTKDSAMVKRLIDMGARVNDRDNHQSTALMMTDNAQIAESLIKAGADIEAKDDMNRTPLMLAAGAGYTSVVKVLINSGANINTTAKEGYTPLMSAITNEHIDTAKILIDFGADVNAKNSECLTALMLAVKTRNINAVNTLIRAKSDIDAENRQGIDALALSFSEGTIDISEALLNAGANPNKLYDGKTLLHREAQEQHWKYPSGWKLLLRYNVNVNRKDIYGKTALDYSLDHDWTFSDELDMARALVRKGAEVSSDTRYIMKKHNIESSKLYNNESSNVATKLWKDFESGKVTQKIFKSLFG